MHVRDHQTQNASIHTFETKDESSVEHGIEEDAECLLEEDGIDDLPEFKPSIRKARTAVSAEAHGDWNTKLNFIPPIYPKSDDQKLRISSMLANSFLFTSLDSRDLSVIIDAMDEVKVEASSYVINQGDDGDFLFIVESGSLNCLKKNADDNEVKLVKVCETGDVFGELSLLYNVPRAASVVAVSDCVLWKLERITFNHIVSDSAFKKRERYESFLKNVPLLSQVGAYEISQIADALQSRMFKAGELIVEEGDRSADIFYILEEGAADAFRSGYHVLNYSHPGEYFGELSLIRNEPRAATVKAGLEGCRVLMLDRKTFNRLIGHP